MRNVDAIGKRPTRIAGLALWPRSAVRISRARVRADTRIEMYDVPAAAGPLQSCRPTRQLCVHKQPEDSVEQR